MMNKNICNKENLEGHIKWLIANPDNEIHYYTKNEDLFYISFSSFDGRLNLYDENRNIMESIDWVDVSVECLTDLFAAHIDIWMEKHHKKEAKLIDYEQKYWDCQRQIDEYERERKELQERIDILNNKKFKSECSKLKDDKKKAEERIKELKCKVTKLEADNRRLDERNTYITHHFGVLRKEYCSLNIKLECALGHANSALDITKQYDPSWTLVEDRLKIIQAILSQDTPNEKKSCKGCRYEDWQLTHIKCMICKTQKTQYEPKNEPKSCEGCKWSGFLAESCAACLKSGILLYYSPKED